MLLSASGMLIRRARRGLVAVFLNRKRAPLGVYVMCAMRRRSSAATKLR
jgi:NADH:ubiquinone oxidoreductase subunit 2 (subunit N)